MLKNKENTESVKSEAEGTNVDSTVVNGADESVSNKGIEKTLCSYIRHTLLPTDYGIALNPKDDLLSIDCLDSMQFMRLAQFIEKTYQLKIPAEDLLIENFQTVERLTGYLAKRMSSV